MIRTVKLRCGLQSATAQIAEGPRARLLGLLSGPPRVLVLPGTRAIHTCGMRYAIDVWFLDAALAVLRVRRVRPWRAAMAVSACHAVEVPAGMLAPPAPGEAVSWA